jgi:arsenate reductase (thioredoxin)
MKNDLIKKNVLILASDDASLSNIAQAVLNRYLRGVQAYSAGINATKKLDPNTKKLLQEDGSWKDEYHPKTFEEVKDIDFDLVITLSDLAMKKCPEFGENTDIIQIEYEELDSKNFSEYKKSLKLMQMEITPIVRMHFAM